MTPTQAATWTAVGTLALAAVTFVALFVTIVVTREDRKRADRNLTCERRLAEVRLKQERDHAERIRRRERQADNVRALLQRMAVLQPCLGTVPGVEARIGPSNLIIPRQSDEECREAMASLTHGALAEVPLLGADNAAQEAAARYRFFVGLVRAAAKDNSSDRERLAGTLRSYARWLKISLRMLAENQTVPMIQDGSTEYPVLGVPDDMPQWQPSPIPPGWHEEADTEITR